MGAVISAYHYYLQLGGSSFVECSTVGYSASCSDHFTLQYGYITIPMMALTAFVLIILFSLASNKTLQKIYRTRFLNQIQHYPGKREVDQYGDNIHQCCYHWSSPHCWISPQLFKGKRKLPVQASLQLFVLQLSKPLQLFQVLQIHDQKRASSPMSTPLTTPITTPVNIS